MTEISESLNELKNCINSYSGLPTGVTCRIGDTQGRVKGIGSKTFMSFTSLSVEHPADCPECYRAAGE